MDVDGRDDVHGHSLGTAGKRYGSADCPIRNSVCERPGLYPGHGSALGSGIRHAGRQVRLCRLYRGCPALRRRGRQDRGPAGTLRDAGHHRRAHPPRPGRPLGRPVRTGGGRRRERRASRDRQDAVPAEGGNAGLVAAIRGRAPVRVRDRAGDVGCGRLPAARAA